MKNILIITYYYPPKGGAGVQRSAKLAKYLNRLGYNVHVLTVQEDAPGIMDESLLKDIHKDIKVYRTKMKKVFSLEVLINKFRKEKIEDVHNTKAVISVDKESSLKKNYIMNFLKKVIIDIFLMLNIPDDKKGWIEYAVNEGNKIIKEQAIDLIYTTSAPASAHFIGKKLKKANSVLWIADFRDSWAQNKIANYNKLMTWIYGILESKIVKGADRVTSVSEPIVKDFILRYKGLPKEKFLVIPNGYDEEDFTLLNLEKSRSNEKFEILYNGTLYANEDPTIFFQALHNLINSGRIKSDELVIKFNGKIGSFQKQIINYYASIYPEMIIQNDFKEHKESIKDFEFANALLLIIGEGEGSEGVYTGKIFEYIRAKKPIIGIVPEGVAKKLIVDTETGYTVFPKDVTKLEGIIYELYENFVDKVDNKYFNPRWEIINKYSRENLAKSLIHSVEGLN